MKNGIFAHLTHCELFQVFTPICLGFNPKPIDVSKKTPINFSELWIIIRDIALLYSMCNPEEARLYCYNDSNYGCLAFL